MAVNLSIKSVPDELAERLRQRAERNHRSLQGELMALLEQALAEPVPLPALAVRSPLNSKGLKRGSLSLEEISQMVDATYAALPPRPAGVPSGTEIVREMRDTRWN